MAAKKKMTKKMTPMKTSGSERVVGNRIHSKREVWEHMGGGTYGSYIARTSDALVTPTVKKKPAYKKSATKKR